MMHFDDDVFSYCEYPCSGCDQKRYLLDRLTGEVAELQRIYFAWKKKNAAFEDLFESMLEDACHTASIDFKGV